MKTRTIFFIVAAALLSASCNNGGYHRLRIPEEVFASELDSLENEYAPSLQRGQAAPGFSLPDTLGNTINLYDYQNKIVVLDFWASWCGDCRREIPAIKALYEEYKDTKIGGFPVQFISVSFDHDADSWKSVLRKEQFGWPQVSNLIRWKENPVSAAYGLHWIPTFYVIDPEGRVISGCITAARVGEILSSLK